MPGESVRRYLSSRMGRLTETAPTAPSHGPLEPDSPDPEGGFASIDGEECYRISGFDRMPPFLMNVASDADLWMFVTSRGGLTAGRADADGSLFPYETVDKLQDAHHHTGPISILRVRREGKSAILWEPFYDRSDRGEARTRCLYKNAVGNRVIFEEVRHDLDLTFRYRWSTSNEFGLVRTVQLLNQGEDAVSVSILDGLRNVLPFGVPLALIQKASSLVDAYKRVDVDPETRLGLFSLTSKIVDRAEAVEELRTNIVWSHGLEDVRVCLSLDAVAAFRSGRAATSQNLLTGQRGNYFVVSSFGLEPQSRVKWHIVGDVGLDHLQVAKLLVGIREDGDLDHTIEDSLENARESLLRNVGSADALQLTNQPGASTYHLANVLFNNMRGGVFLHNYSLPTMDFVRSVVTRNRPVARRHSVFLDAMPAEVSAQDVLAAAERTGDADFLRLSYEYLPIHFSRRHGDPSRPWNQFAIRLRNRDGTRALGYEGNWRDIFQNWEALAVSFPRFLPNMIAKFVNASTVDGFNPYRVTQDGFEWEVADPDDPWSHIGYWGDHQIVYLFRLLDATSRFLPGVLENALEREVFCYAEIPYRIRPYRKILEDPHATIDYDSDHAARIGLRVREIGTDGKLLRGPDGAVYHVNLIEKLLVPALSKLSNLVPDGGIWMNTQRPEWNDANNALAGNGISVVTLCHLCKYLRIVEDLLRSREGSTATISTEVVRWFHRVRRVLDEKRPLLDTRAIGFPDRRSMLDDLGEAFSEYRAAVYAGGFSGKKELPVREVTALCRVATEFLDHSIRANRREDGLYHSYNVLQVSGDGDSLAVRQLHEMLEGQVAALTSGVVPASEALGLVSRLFESRLYREDQKSFLLYPERELPRFLEKNVVSDRRLLSVPLLRNLIAAGETGIVARDALGVCRFSADLRNARDLGDALGRLAQRDRWRDQVARDRREVLEIYEEVFAHRSFTGRSGTMYGYEGIGCVYWHMVSKLLLAVQETTLHSYRDGQPTSISLGLSRAYYRIRAGLGFEKTPLEYGAFPTDPYSHTPRHAGAQQPGMTGQVKEGILTRFGELGVQVEGGRVSFLPVLLRPCEFRTEVGTYRFYDVMGTPRSIEVLPGSLAFSFCQVPILYELLEEHEVGGWVRVVSADGISTMKPGNRLDEDASRAIFDRTGTVSRIDVGVPRHTLCDLRTDSPGTE